MQMNKKMLAWLFIAIQVNFHLNYKIFMYFLISNYFLMWHADDIDTYFKLKCN